MASTIAQKRELTSKERKEKGKGWIEVLHSFLIRAWPSGKIQEMTLDHQIKYFHKDDPKSRTD